MFLKYLEHFCFAVVPQPMPSSGWEEDDELRTPTVEEQNFPDSKVPLRSSSEHPYGLCFGNMSLREGL